jgi:hypothetical protein
VAVEARRGSHRPAASIPVPISTVQQESRPAPSLAGYDQLLAGAAS